MLRRWKRDGFFLLLGLWVGVVFIAPASVFAQAPTAVGVAASGTLPLDQGTAAAVTKFVVDLVKRVSFGSRQAPSIVVILAVVITGPSVVALLLLKDRVNLLDPAVIAGTIITGLFVAAGGAALLTMAHDEARKPEANIPRYLADVPKAQRAQLCCLHGDCRSTQQSARQVAEGLPAVPVLAAQPVPTSPPEPPPDGPPIVAPPSSPPYSGMKG
jgi:hypothetical protein